MAIFLLACFVVLTGTSAQPDGYCTSPDDPNCAEGSALLSRPNIVLLLADDLGYGDLASYGHPIQEQGPLDEMAHGGVRFTQFYSADSMCSPSRAAMLTGRLPIRSGIVGGRRVFVDFDTGGLPSHELTIAEALQELGYVTGFVGKWHLGINNKTNTDGAHLPWAHGFDFVGHNLPLTDLWQCDESQRLMKDGPDQTKCYVYKDRTIVQQPISHSTLTNRLLNDFRLFLNMTYDKDKQKPFFFYFSFTQVHTSLETAPRFVGASKRGLFGDNVQELQYAVGDILKLLRDRPGLPEKTLVLFLSDHGPHKEICSLGGSTGGLRGGKGNSFEGGVRVPAIAYWPTVIQSGTISNAVVSSLDLLPSFVALAGGKLPDDRVFDGMDVHTALLNLDDPKLMSKLGKRTLYFYCNEKLAAVRHRNLKFHLLTSPEMSVEDNAYYCPDGGKPIRDWYKAQMCADGDMQKHDPPLVYDLNVDPFEVYQLSKESSKAGWDKVKVLIEKHRKTIVQVEKQLGRYDPKVIPCCDAPKCKCDYPDI